MGKLLSTSNKGFRMTFDNGFNVSVQWGAGNYCDNHWDCGFNQTHDWQSSCAEIAIWHDEHPDVNDWIAAVYFMSNVIGEGHGGVVGYVDPEDIAELLWRISVEDINLFWTNYAEWYRHEYDGQELKWHSGAIKEDQND